MTQSLHVVCPACDSVNRVPVDKLQATPAQNSSSNDSSVQSSSSKNLGVCGVCRQPLFPGRPLELDQARFAKHISRNQIPVLVDFWAPWCGPCKMMAPVFAEAAQLLEPRARLAKVNTEAEGALAAQMNIRSIPTLVLFRNGSEVARIAGAMNKENLLAWVGQNL